MPLAGTALKLADASDVVFLGTGGSSLGGQALAQLADYGVAGLDALRSKARLHFLDNLDPFTMERLLAKFHTAAKLVPTAIPRPAAKPTAEPARPNVAITRESSSTRVSSLT